MVIKLFLGKLRRSDSVWHFGGQLRLSMDDGRLLRHLLHQHRRRHPRAHLHSQGQEEGGIRELKIIFRNLIKFRVWNRLILIECVSGCFVIFFFEFLFSWVIDCVLKNLRKTSKASAKLCNCFGYRFCTEGIKLKSPVFLLFLYSRNLPSGKNKL